MRVYHVSNDKFDKIDLSRSNKGKDFGHGFYLFNDLSHAKQWKSNGFIYQYDLELTDLNVYYFDVDVLWLAYVCINRQYLGYQYLSKFDLSKYEKYDVIIGPAVGMNNYYLVSDFLKGKDDVNEILKKITSQGYKHQIVLKSNLAVSKLTNRQVIDHFVHNISGNENIITTMGDIFEYAIAYFNYDLISFTKTMLQSSILDLLYLDHSLFCQGPYYIIDSLLSNYKIMIMDSKTRQYTLYLMQVAYWLGKVMMEIKVESGLSGNQILNKYDIEKIILDYEQLKDKNINYILDNY